MKIQPIQIIHSGPGVDLSNQPEGLAVQMSDPVEDFDYARNAVTLTFDLSGYEHVRLSFEAMEFGDEPHAPPPGPFADDVDFDGVAISADGVAWYEVQDLRSLRSDRFTAYDIDLDAAVAALGIAYGNAFRIRFCQYDNNPAPMDGVFLHRIEVTGDLRPPIFQLPMDDNAATTTVLDTSEGHRHQTFVDPGGNPNTVAHSVPGMVGRALAFDGVDDQINCGATLMNDVLAAGRDWAVGFWWKHPFTLPSGSRRVFQKGNSTRTIQFYQSDANRMYASVIFAAGSRLDANWANLTDGAWHHYVVMRKGTTIQIYRDNVLAAENTVPGNVGDLSNPDNLMLGARHGGGFCAAGTMDDFRIYARALLAQEIESLQH